MLQPLSGAAPPPLQGPPVLLNVAVAAALLLAQEGPFLPPPAPDPAVPLPLVQPGMGPQLPFQADRWEWWLDFNQEWLLDLRARAAAAAEARGDGWLAVTPEDRRQVLLPALALAGRSGARDVRAAAALALGRLAEPAALPLLEELAEDRELFVRLQATLALGVSGLPAAGEALAGRLRDGREPAQVRSYAAVALGLLGDDAAFHVLAERLTPRRLAAEEYQVRFALVAGAGVSAHPQAVPVLLALQRSDLVAREPSLRAVLAAALGQLGSEHVLPALLALLRDDHAEVRRAAAAALAGAAVHLTAEQAGALAARLSDENDLSTRCHVLRALGRARDPAVTASLARELDRLTTMARPHAALAIAAAGDPALLPALLAAFHAQREPSQRGALVVALGLLGRQEAVAPLLELLERQREPSLAGYASLALGLLGADAAAARLRDLAAESHEPEVVHWSVAGLALLGRQADLEQLSDVAAVAGTMDRAARLFALGQVGDRRFVEPLLALTAEPKPGATSIGTVQPAYVRAYAWQALGRIADPRARDPLGRLSAFVEPGLDEGFLAELYRQL